MTELIRECVPVHGLMTAPRHFVYWQVCCQTTLLILTIIPLQCLIGMKTDILAVGGKVFDVGNQTFCALNAFKNGISPEKSGMVNPNGKGNGALMRVLPLVLWHRVILSIPLYTFSSKFTNLLKIYSPMERSGMGM